MPEAAADTGSLRLPAEWEPHRACWLAFPYRAHEWQGHLQAARHEQAALMRAIADPDPATGEPRGEQIELLVADEATEAAARALLGTLPVRYHRMRYGDSWTRDTGPIFVDRAGRLGAAAFAFDGWGGKYRMPGDADLAGRIAERVGLSAERFEHVVEGGAIDVDGEGTCLASSGALLPPHRNPHARREALEQTLRGALGVERVLWIDGALRGDHTDGHVDTLARFVAPATVVCMEAHPDGPNGAVLDAVLRGMRQLEDARGRRLRAVALPSPGRVADAAGNLLPASYCNFYVGNRVVAVPAYGRPTDEAAAARLAELFPTRRVVSLSAQATLLGGGAFHCITREEPALGAGAAAR